MECKEFLLGLFSEHFLTKFIVKGFNYFVSKWKNKVLRKLGLRIWMILLERPEYEFSLHGLGLHEKPVTTIPFPKK
jgi:hypothetical protein